MQGNHEQPFDFALYLCYAEEFGLTHPTVLAFNSNRSNYVGVIAAEWQEFVDEFMKSELSDPNFPLLSELADFVFGLAFYTYIHLPRDFHYQRAERQVRNQSTDSQLFEKTRRQIQRLSKPEDAPEAMLKLLATAQSLVHALPPNIFFSKQFIHTYEKNGRNYPFELHTHFHPQTHQRLAQTGLVEKYRHVVPSTRLIRHAYGKPPDGILPEQWQPFQYYLNEIDHPERAQFQLRQKIDRLRANGFFERARNSV